MSGAVGSMPSLIRSGRPLASCRSRAPSGKASTAFRSRKLASEASGSVTVAMLDSRPRRTELEARRRPVLRGPPAARPPMPDSTPIALGPDAAIAEPVELKDRSRSKSGGPRATKPKLKKLRLSLVLLGLGLLALTSLLFGMLMAVAKEIPSLENSAQFKTARNSTMLAADGKPIARLTGNENRILIDPEEISPMIKNAVIAVEDRRFNQHHGVDLKGMARAAVADITNRGKVQGGSTITEQFVKNALAAQNNRTVFEKLREAALAYHLERQWSKQKI